MFKRFENWFTKMWWTKGWFQMTVVIGGIPLAFILLMTIWFIPVM